jgi:hypothetical protein
MEYLKFVRLLYKFRNLVAVIVLAEWTYRLSRTIRRVKQKRSKKLSK